MYWMVFQILCSISLNSLKQMECFLVPFILQLKKQVDNWRGLSEWYPSQTRFQTQPFLTSKPMFLFYHPVKKHFIFKTLSIWFIFFSISVLNLGKAEMDWHIYPPFLLTPHLNEYKGMKHTNWRKWRNWDRLKRGQEQNPAK